MHQNVFFEPKDQDAILRIVIAGFIWLLNSPQLFVWNDGGLRRCKLGQWSSILQLKPGNIPQLDASPLAVPRDGKIEACRDKGNKDDAAACLICTRLFVVC